MHIIGEFFPVDLVFSAVCVFCHLLYFLLLLFIYPKCFHFRVSSFFLLANKDCDIPIDYRINEYTCDEVRPWTGHVHGEDGYAIFLTVF